MACRPAPACRAVLDQANERWPDRLKASDGICASPRHTQQNPTSDHEPDVNGIAHAVDITHDPAHGVDCDEIVNALIRRQDPRVKYVIYAGRIWRSYKTAPRHPEPWISQAYTGSNPHTKHCHISVWTEHENDTSPWFTEEFTMDDEARRAFATISGRLDVLEDQVAKALDAIAGWQPGRKERSLIGRIGDHLKVKR